MHLTNHFAGEQGFEPRSATLKAAVLPLNHSPEQSSRLPSTSSVGSCISDVLKILCKYSYPIKLQRAKTSNTIGR